MPRLRAFDPGWHPGYHVAMRIVIAPDSFKECASAMAVSEAIAEGVRRVYPTAELVLAPMADGGEGTVDALVAATGGQYVTTSATGPLGDEVEATYGLLGDGQTAIIEMAAVSGLELAEPGRRDPRVATTHGTGELIRHALERGASCIILGIGGSATNDAGSGMAQALGYSLVDEDGQELPPGGAALARLDRIDAAGKHPGLDACVFRVACDVDNPLCGPQGASFVFGPQKGADEAAVSELDAALKHWSEIVARDLGAAVSDIPGAGAAGGLGAGMVAYTGATLEPGAALVAEACKLRERMAGADFVITGEGRLDGQTSGGKTPLGVARVAAELNIPVLGLAGALGDGHRVLYDCGFDAMISICPGPVDKSTALRCAGAWLADAAEALAGTWRAAAKAQNT